MVQMQSDLNFGEVKALFPNLSDSEINKIIEDSGSSSQETKVNKRQTS